MPGKQTGQRKPKNTEKDSYSYWLPHDIPVLIAALAEHEGKTLHIDGFAPADYLTRVIRTLAEELLPPDQIEKARVFAEERRQERLQKVS